MLHRSLQRRADMCVIQKDTLMCYTGVCREGQICVCYTERHFNVLHRSLQRRADMCVLYRKTL